MRDLVSNISVVASVVPAVLTATTNGTGVDLQGFDSAALVIQSGAIVSSGNFTPKLQDSADNSTWVDVAASDLVGTFPAALAASSVYEVGYIGSKRYVRPVLTLNSGTSIAASAVVIKSNATQKPV